MFRGYIVLIISWLENIKISLPLASKVLAKQTTLVKQQQYNKIKCRILRRIDFELYFYMLSDAVIRKIWRNI